jgi:hypothetical protein
MKHFISAFSAEHRIYPHKLINPKKQREYTLKQQKASFKEKK